jgi:putative endonuclease
MGRGRKRISADSSKQTQKDSLRVRPRQPALSEDEMPASHKYFCYILECADGTFYTGWSTDPERRVRQHNNGTGGRYTRSRRPVQIVYVEEQPDRVTAMKRERAIKALPREKKNKLMGGEKVNP